MVFHKTNNTIVHLKIFKSRHAQTIIIVKIQIFNNVTSWFTKGKACMPLGEEIKQTKNNAMWSNNNINRKTKHLSSTSSSCLQENVFSPNTEPNQTTKVCTTFSYKQKM